MTNFRLYIATPENQITYFSEPREIDSLDAYIEAVRVNHTPILFGGDRRRVQENFTSANCLHADIDNSFSEDPAEHIGLDEIRDALAGFTYGVNPSRNHGKRKPPKPNGHPDDPGLSERERWHLQFPAPEIKSQETFRSFHKKLIRRFPGLHFDPVIHDGARFFYGNGGGFPRELYILELEGKPITAHLTGPEAVPEDPPFEKMTAKEILENPGWFHGKSRRNGAKRLFALLARDGLSAEEILKKGRDWNARIPEPREWKRGEMEDLADWAVENCGAEFKHIRNFYWGEGKKGPKPYPLLTTTEEMKESYPFFLNIGTRGGKKTLALRSDPMTPIQSPADLSSSLEKVGYDLQILEAGGGMTRADIFSRYRNSVVNYERIICIPEADPQGDTFYFPIEEYPAPEDNGALLEYLEKLTFNTPGDRIRFTAGMLSLFMNSSFDGKRPLFAIIAGAQSSGKTTVIRETFQILTGVSLIEQAGGKTNLQHDMAQFSGLVALATPGVLYDNQEDISSEMETFLSRIVTDSPYRESWDFGDSRSPIRNSFVYFATFNDSEGFNKDLQARTIAVRMKDAGEVPREQRTEIDAHIRYWKGEGRKKLQANARFFAEMMKDRDSGVRGPEKFGEWCRAVAPPLKELFPGVEVFDFTMNDEDHKVNPNASVLLEFFLQWLKSSGKLDPASGVWEVSGSTAEITARWNIVNGETIGKENTTSMGKKLKSVTGPNEVGEIQRFIHPSLRTVMFSFRVKDAVFQRIRDSIKGEGGTGSGGPSGTVEY